MSVLCAKMSVLCALTYLYLFDALICSYTSKN